jgi:DNA-binding MarR family transcriptional regulator
MSTATDYTQHPDTAIIATLAGLSHHFHKSYCFPSQDKLRSLHAKHTGRDLSSRALNRHLGGLEAAGWITRQRRHRNVQGRGWEFRSTLYALTRKGWRWIASLNQAAHAAAGWKPSATFGKQSQLQQRVIASTPPSSGPTEGNKERALRELDKLRRGLTAG